MTRKEPLLSVQNLHVKVEEKEILKGVNLTIYPGEVHAIMGVTALANPHCLIRSWGILATM